MSPMKTRDLIRMLEDNGFALMRSGKHKMYSNGIDVIGLTHDKTTSTGMVREVLKLIKKSAKQQSYSHSNAHTSLANFANNPIQKAWA